MTLLPVRFPHPPFDLVALHGFTEASRNKKADLSFIGFLIEKLEMLSLPPIAIFQHRFDIAGFFYDFLFGKSGIRGSVRFRQRIITRLFLFIADGQFRTAFCTAAFQHSTTVFGSHTGPESVFIFPFTPTRLICTFHII